MEVDLARFDGDRGAVTGAGGEIEAVLEQARDGLPILLLRREQERPLDRGGLERIVFDGRADTPARALAVA